MFHIVQSAKKKKLFSSSLCRESDSNNLYNLWKCIWREGKNPREDENDDGKEGRIGRKKAGSVYRCLTDGIVVFMIIKAIQRLFWLDR